MHGRWISSAARVYYFAGALYYLYKWLWITASGGLAFSVLAYVLHLPYVAYSIAPLSLVVLLWSVVLAAKKKTIRLQSHNPGLREISLESIYTTLGGNQYSYSRRAVVRALYDGVDHYQHKINWSGVADVATITPTMEAPHRTTVSRVRNSPHLLCRVDLERPLKKGEERDFTFLINLTDVAGIAQLFLGHISYCPIANVILRIRLEPNSNILAYKRQLLASPTADIPVFEERVVLHSTSTELSWDIDRPRLGYLYRIIPD
jgi:hypothetical protein